MSVMSRRRFLRRTSLVVGSAAVLPLSQFQVRQAMGMPRRGSGFGDLTPQLAQNAADLTNTIAGDLSNTPMLELPPGFRYWAYSITGQTMSDGNPVPGDHDGMAAFPGPDGTFLVVRNHELSPGENEAGNTDGVIVPAAMKHDTGATGGTSNLVFTNDGELISHFNTLGGTIRNCAGGPTPWGTWISCEEDVRLPEGDITQRHGYNFEVPANATGPVQAVPLVAMGRFNHEACAVDPVSGHVFQTEDRGDSCFYRFRPTTPGDLSAGVLEALVVSGEPNLDTGSGQLTRLGIPMDVAWVTINEVDPAADTIRDEAQSKGAATFVRGEGAWYGNGLIYFVCTSGGDIGAGQVWAYDPAAQTLTLVVESTDANELESPDNITVGPADRLYLCEDGGGQQFIVGVEPNGVLFQIARNALDNSEFAGACFSPDGRFMLVNSQGLGVTYLIEGPWREAIHSDGFEA